MRLISIIIGLLRFCCFALAAEPDASVIPVTVHLITFPDQATISEPHLAALLDRTATAIDQVCGKKVAFKISETQEAGAFFQQRQKAIDPFTTPSKWFINPFGANTNDNFIRLNRILHDEYSPEKIVQLDKQLDLDGDDPYADLARYLTIRRTKHWVQLLQERDLDGSWLLTQDNCVNYSEGQWITYLYSMEWSNDVNLYITNGLLMDTTPGGMTANELDCPIAINAVSMMASKSAVFSYYSIFSPSLKAASASFGRLTPADKDNAFVFVLAQCVGVQLLLHQGPQTADDAGLARPIWSIPNASFLADVHQWKLKSRAPEVKRLSNGMAQKTELRMAVFAAKGDMQCVKDEVARSKKYDLSPNERKEIDDFLLELEAKDCNYPIKPV